MYFFLQQKTENVLQEMLNKKNVIPIKEQMNAVKDSMAVNQTSFCLSPPFIERIRCKTVENNS